MHLILAGISSVLTIAIVFVGAFAFKDINLFIFSLVSGTLIFISGIFTAVGAARKLKFFGLLERITIGSYMIWLFVASLCLCIAEIRAMK